MNKDYIVLGRITGHFGVKGWIKIKSYTRPMEHILDFPVWHLVAGQVDGQSIDATVSHLANLVEPDCLTLTGGRKQGPGVIAGLENIGSREEAESVIGKSILVPQSALEVLTVGEYYWSQLIGLRVSNTEGTDFGSVDHLLETGANDVMVVIEKKSIGSVAGNGATGVPSTGESGNERLLPWSSQVVLRVDLEQGTMLVDWDADF